MKARALLFFFALTALSLHAQQALETKPADPFFAKFEPVKAPAPQGLLLKAGDRLAICGDSITEQKMYSQLMELYLTVCVPELGVTVRQYGWGGERAPGFLARMAEDCLRFSPTIATTCYGMNDHGYRPYEPGIGKVYRENQAAIVKAFKQAGVRVVLGSAGCVGPKNQPGWDAEGVEQKNLNLCTLRNLDIEIAAAEQVVFADVFWPMLTASFEAKRRHGPDFAVPGHDGVHPRWAGHVIMAYAFLKALGLNGDIGTFTVDYASGQATATAGHEVVGSKPGELTIESTRYPICATGDPSKDDNIRAGMALVPFHEQLNRLMLVVKNAPARAKVTWGAETRSYPAAQLAQGVNLAADFENNPFSGAFKLVQDAVLIKQAYETKQVKQIFHDLINGKFKTAEEIQDPEIKHLFTLRDSSGKFDREAIVKATEATRAPLAAAIKSRFVPVTHTLKVEAE